MRLVPPTCSLTRQTDPIIRLTVRLRYVREPHVGVPERDASIDPRDGLIIVIIVISLMTVIISFMLTVVVIVVITVILNIIFVSAVAAHAARTMAS